MENTIGERIKARNFEETAVLGNRLRQHLLVSSFFLLE